MHRLGQLGSNRLVKDVLVLFGVQIGTYLLPLLTLPYLTRVLGPTNFGLLALGIAFANYFAVIVDYGFSVTGTRRVAAVQSDPAAVSTVYSLIYSAKILLLGASLAVYLPLVFFLPQLSPYWPIYLLSFLYVIGYGFSPNWFFQGLQQMRWVAISDYSAKILSVLLIFVLVHSPADYLIAAAIQSSGFLIASLIGHAVIFRLFQPRLIWPSTSQLRQALAEAWPVFLSFGVLILMSSTNTMILGFVSTPAAAGFLNAAMRLILAARALTNPITNAVYPQISKLVAQSRLQALVFLRKQILFSAAPFLALSLAMFILGPWAVEIFYGPKYTETGILLRILSPIPFAHALSMSFSTYYMLAFGHEKAWSGIITRVVLFNLIAIGVLVPLIDPLRAVAIATTLSDVFSAASSYWYYRRNSPLEVDSAEAK